MAKKYQLKNGLNVLLVESRKSPVVSVQMWVRTGSADEPKKLRGISHFIEHLVFKGSEKFNVGEIASKIEGEGGELNAYTSFDRTVYHVTISNKFLETGLEVISEMMGFPSFISEEIDNERGVVIEEIKRGEDNPGRQASRALFSTVYKNHPYGEPVIGYEPVIEKVTREEIVDYFHARYVPSNMTLVVVGDFDSQDLRPLVKKYFATFEDYPLKKVKRTQEPKQDKLRIHVKQEDFEETLLHIAWRIPKASHKDIPALDLLSMVLGHGDSSRLMKALRIEQSLANYCVASTYTPKDPGFFVISSSLHKEKIEAGLQQITEELRQILESPATADELNRVKVAIESGEYFSLETVDGMASKYGTYEDLFGDYKKYKDFLKAIQTITPEDLTKIARKYLSPETLSVITLSKLDKVDLKKQLRRWASGYKKAFAEAKSHKLIKDTKYKSIKFKLGSIGESKKIKMEKIKLGSGASIIIRPTHETPVVSVRVAFLGGARCEHDDEHGVNELLSRTWATATQSMSEQELYQRTEEMATRLSSFSGRNTAGLSMTCLSPFLNRSDEILKDVLAEPLFSESVIDREKLYLKEYIKNRSDNPSSLCILNFMEQMFPDHPYGKDPYGDEKSVDLIERDATLAHWRRMVSANNMTISAVGAFDVDKMISGWESFTKDLPIGDRLESEWDLPDITEPSYRFIELDKKQSHIVIGWRGLKFKDPAKFDLQVLQAILGGQGGRLFLELRDKESLAYSVSPLRMDGIDGGYFGAYIGCSPEKAKKSLRMLKEEFDKLCQQKIGEDELLRAKRYLIGSHDI
ncbi:MAG: insulinase family protein, partial [Bdellovibrionales bacterium]|nr:insulinase family protein [Bdellovibrionales bacterium]